MATKIGRNEEIENVDITTTFSIVADTEKKQVVVIGMLRNSLEADWHVACQNPKYVVDSVFTESAIGMATSQQWIANVNRDANGDAALIVGRDYRWDTPWKWIQGTVRKAVADDMRRAFGGTFAQTVNA